MKQLLLPILCVVLAFSAYGQKTKIFRGYLCEKIDARMPFNQNNPDGQFGLAVRDDPEFFVFRVFGIPMELTKTFNKADPKNDKIGTEYRVTYVTDDTGSFMAKTVTKTGRFTKVPECLLGDPMPAP